MFRTNSGEGKLQVEDFIRRKEVLQIFSDEAITDLAEIVEILETYKFCTRTAIVQVLEQHSANKVSEVENLPWDPEFEQVEKEYNVRVTKVDDKRVVVYYSYFFEVNRDAVELFLDHYQVIFSAVTPFNYKCLLDPDRNFVHYSPSILFKRILLEAIDLKATDLHFCVEHPELDCIKYPIKYRSNGLLYEMKLFELTPDLNASIINSLIEHKTDANSLDLITPAGVTAMSNDPLGNGEIELRIAANKVLDGIQCVIRIQQKETFNFSIEKLGFPEQTQDTLLDMTRKRAGLVLITGAIRTGKNTTAFALARELVKQPVKIVSYEYPVEALMPFTQIDYNGDTETLLNAVRLAKKQDVNVAFLNEIPDKSVAFAVQDLVNSSVYVITTMHVDRLWHLPYKLKEYYGEEYKNVISQINGVFNQKMFQVACPDCRKMVLAESLDRKLSKFFKERNITSVPIYTGCGSCNHTGNVPGANQPYVEYLEFDEDLKEKLLACEQPYQMEQILKRRVFHDGVDFESILSEAVTLGKLQPEALYSIL